MDCCYWLRESIGNGQIESVVMQALLRSFVVASLVLAGIPQVACCCSHMAIELRAGEACPSCQSESANDESSPAAPCRCKESCTQNPALIDASATLPGDDRGRCVPTTSNGLLQHPMQTCVASATARSAPTTACRAAPCSIPILLGHLLF